MVNDNIEERNDIQSFDDIKCREFYIMNVIRCVILDADRCLSFPFDPT